uniref:Uncharacterized protein n=1 Tax=Myoviridae sp. ct3Sw5 TaxID=2826609 RepID=A0A8S5MPN3_9CAUD|nr:MAG TPA: hypothetical protein [Myoviridae sp. ct3Sw5]
MPITGSWEIQLSVFTLQTSVVIRSAKLRYK